MGFAALFSSLALMASGPANLVLAQADAPAPEAPIATTATSDATQANADAVARGEEAFPTGAPTDDYGFVAWCYGALSGHLALYDKVLPEVRRIEAEFPDSKTPIDKIMDGYAVQHRRGERLLVVYSHALDGQEAAGKAEVAGRPAAIAKGKEIWTGADTANPKQVAQLWMSWALPGRCQQTAAKMATKSAAR
jgi:hypothetical protein